MKYRTEIDGLRAIAVLPVIFFHGGYELFSGGYVGVDVFFVISGYLITTLIVTERHQGSFSLVNFYERRTRRILPTLVFIMLCCLPFAWFWMLPYQLMDFAQSGLAVALFISNVFFWRSTGYFETSSELKPLLHTWSLAVEEQYYLLFPLFVIAMWRLVGSKNLVWFLVIALIVSLGMSEWSWRHKPGANFFLLPTRAWELLMGSMVAMYLNRRPAPAGPANQWAAAAGLGIIIVSIFAFDHETPFPSLYALAPVGGTALIILFATRETWVNRLLSLRGLVTIGLISYSAYLWHQPLFAFARVREPEPSKVLMTALGVLSLVLAWLTWRFVERPFRSKERMTRKQIFAFGALANLTIIVVFGGVVLVDAFVGRYPAYQHQFVAVSPYSASTYVQKNYREMKSHPTSLSKKKLLIIGDSFSEDFYNIIVEAKAFQGYDVFAVGIAARCQIYLGEEPVEKYIKAPDRRFCVDHKITEAVLNQARIADVVIFAARWQKWAADHLPETLRKFQFNATQKVFVIGTKNFGLLHVRTSGLLTLDEAELSAFRIRATKAALDVNATMVATLPEGQFINTLAILCDQGEMCPLFTPEAKLISLDGRHLTQAGARFVGQLLFKNAALEQFSFKGTQSH